jgi:hypothetical protein
LELPRDEGPEGQPESVRAYEVTIVKGDRRIA